jgi:pyruvate/2-oxoglutarate dehydrogenase complex dihydrolipoamide dehydrogenase (E3) component
MQPADADGGEHLGGPHIVLDTRGAALETGNGVVVDARLRSSDPDIYAAGDVANALYQPQTAAKAMLGQDVAYDRLPYFTPANTTWAWNTPATSNPTATTRSYSAATSPGASSSRSG